MKTRREELEKWERRQLDRLAQQSAQHDIKTAELEARLNAAAYLDWARDKGIA